jgi:outer membrane protein TolC
MLALSVVASALAQQSAPTEMTLSEAIFRSLERSFGLEAARRDSAAAALSYGAARSLRFPELTLTARSTYKDEVPGFEIDMPPIVLERELGGKEAYQADLEISQPIFTGGRLSNNIRAERERSLAASAAVRAEEMATAYRCRRAYLEAMLAGQLMGVAASSLERIGTIRKDVETLFENGMADSIDVLDADLALKRAEQEVADQRIAYDLTLTVLRRETGLPQSAQIVRTEELPAPRKRLERSAGPPMYRPELERMQRLANAAEFMASASRADYFPSLAGFARYSYGKPNQNVFDNEWNDYAMVGLRLSWSINLADRSGRSTGALAERARAARWARKELEDELTLQCERAIEQADYAFDTMNRVIRQRHLAQRKLALARERQLAGTLSTNRLLEMESEVYALHSLEVASMIRFYLAENDYLYAIGSTRIFGGIR